jgi:hypothetical protein
VVHKPDAQTLEIRHPNRFQLCHLEKKHGTAIRHALLVFGIMRTVFRQDLPQGEGKMEAARADQRLAQLPLEQQFDLLLKEYPKKPPFYKKNAVRRSFLSLAQNGQLPEITTLLSELRQDRENPVWKVENHRFVPFMGNWLVANIVPGEKRQKPAQTEKKYARPASQPSEMFELSQREMPSLRSKPEMATVTNIKEVFIKQTPLPPKTDSLFPELAESGGVNFSQQEAQPEEHPEEWQTVRELHPDLRDTELVVHKPDAQTLEIRHPNRFQLCHLEKKHGPAIRQALLIFGIMRTVFRQDFPTPQGEGQRETPRADQRLAQLPLEQQFDLLLKKYPKKPMCYKKNEVRRSFLALARNGQLPDITKLLSDLRQDRENPVWKVENYRYVPFLGNWLHGIAAR